MSGGITVLPYHRICLKLAYYFIAECLAETQCFIIGAFIILFTIIFIVSSRLRVAVRLWLSPVYGPTRDGIAYPGMPAITAVF